MREAAILARQSMDSSPKTTPEGSRALYTRSLPECKEENK